MVHTVSLGQGLARLFHPVDPLPAVSYLLRIPDQDSYGNWKIRQMGVYHSFSSDTESHLFILVQSHPPDSDKFSMRLEQFSGDPETRSVFNKYPFCLHELILYTYLHGWRWYLNVLGNQYLNEVCITG